MQSHEKSKEEGDEEDEVEDEEDLGYSDTYAEYMPSKCKFIIIIVGEAWEGRAGARVWCVCRRYLVLCLQPNILGDIVIWFKKY